MCIGKLSVRKGGDSGVSPVIATILMVAITVVMATVVFFIINQIIPNEKNITDNQLGELRVTISSDDSSYIVEVQKMPQVGDNFRMSMDMAAWSLFSDNGLVVLAGRVSEIYMADLTYDGDGDSKPDYPVSFRDRDAYSEELTGITEITVGDAFIILKEDHGGVARDRFEFRVTYEVDGSQRPIFHPVTLIG